MNSTKDHNFHQSHEHGHEHGDAHSHLPSDPELRVKAIETLLLSKGLIDSKTLDELIDTYENRIGPQNGAKVIAKAWVDQNYKKRLLDDATSAIRELRELVNIIKSGKIKLMPVKRQDLSTANQAMSDLRAGKVNGRIVLIPS